MGVTVNVFEAKSLTPQKSCPEAATKSVPATACGAEPEVAAKSTVPEPLPPVRLTVMVMRPPFSGPV